MHHFNYKNGELYCEDLPLTDLAEEVGTPTYVYSHATLTRHFFAFDRAFDEHPHLTCYSVKSSSNLSLLRLFSNLGAGADIVSGGELFRALKAGVPPERIVFSGVGKTREEITNALKADILMLNVESSQELTLINELAQEMEKQAPVALRINPDIDPKTHPYITTGLREQKFGIHFNQALSEYCRARTLPGIEVKGLDCHIGSQLTEVGPFTDSVTRLLVLLDRLKELGIELTYLDLGGGLGVTYNDETPPEPDEYARAIREALAGCDLTLILEPGRVLVGNAGILLCRVLYTKPGPEKNFIIVDAAMNDLIRPSLYDSFHAIQPVVLNDRPQIIADVVGPICESGDFLALNRDLPVFAPGELMAVMSAGAYSYVMSSNYNSRPRPAEVLVRGHEYFIIRARESYEDLTRGEEIPDFLLKGA
ncbi:MAG: diaminopimelate decarboxylase [Deltaproteobacteria bacterium]|nr:diaminopimelate decarboxylase [Deltaproteobacteria bacterium]